MFKQDWMERQIDAIARSFAAVLFGKEKLATVLLDYEEEEETSSNLEEEMIRRVINKHINEKNFASAEEMVFKLIEINKSAHNLEVALSFYNELNDMNDELLKQNGLSRERIKSGVKKVREIYDQK